MLEGTLKTHFERYESMYLELIRDDMYVDDLVTGRESLQEVEKMQSEFEKRGFKLHIWQSNEPNLETNDLSSQTKLNFVKEHLATKTNETKTLGFNQDKQRDTFRVEISTESQRLTKRNVLNSERGFASGTFKIRTFLMHGKQLLTFDGKC